MALHAYHAAADAGQHRGLIPGAGADLQDQHPRARRQQRGHERNHVRLADALPGIDGQGAVRVGEGAELLGHKALAGQLAHCGEHALIAYAPAAELALNHVRAMQGRPIQFHATDVTGLRTPTGPRMRWGRP